ncbi:MAG: hypothetical protein RBR74_09260, partial [Ignavibacteriaceae bacterium]|nr:hypothetical protein [Ignavibacteriaceae bacterium]
MKFIINLTAITLLSLSLIYAQSSALPDNTLIKYYSALLSLNLNHATDEARIIYHLSKESSLKIELLENETNKFRQRIKDANADIANIIINTVVSKII